MVLSSSDPRRISPLTGNQPANFSRLAISRFRLILIHRLPSAEIRNENCLG
jgi:hypothetical protein